MDYQMACFDYFIRSNTIDIEERSAIFYAMKDKIMPSDITFNVTTNKIIHSGEVKTVINKPGCDYVQDKIGDSLCSICRYSNKYKNKNLIHEKNIIALFLKDPNIVKESNIVSEDFTAVIQYEDMERREGGKLVKYHSPKTIPIFRLIFDLLSTQDENHESKLEEYLNKNKYTEKNIGYIMNYIAKLKDIKVSENAYNEAVKIIMSTQTIAKPKDNVGIESKRTNNQRKKRSNKSKGSKNPAIDGERSLFTLPTTAAETANEPVNSKVETSSSEVLSNNSNVGNKKVSDDETIYEESNTAIIYENVRDLTRDIQASKYIVIDKQSNTLIIIPGATCKAYHLSEKDIIEYLYLLKSRKRVVLTYNILDIPELPKEVIELTHSIVPFIIAKYGFKGIKGHSEILSSYSTEKPPKIDAEVPVRMKAIVAAYKALQNKELNVKEIEFALDINNYYKLSALSQKNTKYQLYDVVDNGLIEYKKVDHKKRLNHSMELRILNNEISDIEKYSCFITSISFLLYKKLHLKLELLLALVSSEQIIVEMNDRVGERELFDIFNITLADAIEKKCNCIPNIEIIFG